MTHRITRRQVNAGVGVALISPALVRTSAFAQSGGEPIKIGFSMAQTGALAGAGQQALLGAQIWEEEINAAGGLLGRPVKLIYYDDQSNPANVPSIYTKLTDVDKVELVIGPYGTNLVAPALPAIIPKGKVFIGLFALDANHAFHYPKYFSMVPAGPTPKQSFTEGFFEVAAAQNPKPQSVAIAAEDAEFSRNAAEGARENVQKYGLKTVYDKTYPPSTHRLLADHPRHSSYQPGASGNLLVSEQLGRRGAVRQRIGLEAQDDGRRHGRNSIHGHQEKTQIQA